MANSGDETRLAVRLKRSFWHDDRGVHVKISLVPMKRLSHGLDFLKEDSIQVGAKEVILNIINLHKCKDGLYQVVLCNISTDFETGYCDGYDYKLVSLPLEGLTDPSMPPMIEGDAESE